MINKILFGLSVSIAVVLFSLWTYGEFYIVDDNRVAPSNSETFLFVTSLLGSFFLMISYAVIGVVYWKINKNPKRLVIITFFIIPFLTLLALIIGIIPLGANA